MFAAGAFITKALGWDKEEDQQFNSKIFYIMNKGKIKLSFEVDRFKVIQVLAKNCESAEEYNEMMKIVQSTGEVEREDASLEKTHCLLILDRLLHNNPKALLGVRLKKEETEMDAPGENEEKTEEVAGAIEITGEEAKKFMDFVKKLVGKKEEGE